MSDPPTIDQKAVSTTVVPHPTKIHMKRVREELSGAEEVLPNTLRVHNGNFLSKDQKEALLQTAAALASPGKGITACDESAGTIGKRFEDAGVENTEENRRLYRQMLFEGGSSVFPLSILP